MLNSKYDNLNIWKKYWIASGYRIYVTTYHGMDYPNKWHLSPTRHWKASPNVFGCSVHTGFCLCRSLSSGKWRRLCTSNNTQTCPVPELICSSVSRERHLAPTWHIFHPINHCWRRMETTKLGKKRTGLSVQEITLILPADKTYARHRLIEKNGYSLQFE